MAKWLEMELSPRGHDGRTGPANRRVFVLASSVVSVTGYGEETDGAVTVALANGHYYRVTCFPGIDDHEPAAFGVLLDALDIDMVGVWTAEGEVPGGEG